MFSACYNVIKKFTKRMKKIKEKLGIDYINLYIVNLNI